MTTTKTIKIRFENAFGSRNDEVRRLNLESIPSLQALREQCRNLFPLPDDRVWYFKWKDEDGDLVSLTEEYEFQELLALKANEATVHLILFVQPDEAVTAHRPWWMMAHDVGSFGAVPPSPDVEPIHRARCDNTNAHLEPGSGQWYHLPGTSVDLCKTEYERLDAAKKDKFRYIATADDLGADKDRYALPRGGCPRRMGRRHHHCFCPRKPACTAAAAPAPSYRGFCDVTHQRLAVGKGWYHKPGTTYDLCQAAFDRLSAEEKGVFVRVDSVADLGDEKDRYTIGCPLPGLPLDAVVQTAAEVLQSVPDLKDIAADFVDVATDALLSAASPPQPSLSAEVVSGPSVAAGTVVKPGVKVVVLWEVKNAGASGIWTDVRVKPVAPNPFKVDENGFEVPLLEANASGLVSVEFVVPSDLHPGDVSAEFALTDANGQTFGPRLVVGVTVATDDPGVREAELVEQLMEMGLDDAIGCLRAVRECKGDLNAAALALLRGKRQ